MTESGPLSATDRWLTRVPMSALCEPASRGDFLVADEDGRIWVMEVKAAREHGEAAHSLTSDALMAWLGTGSFYGRLPDMTRSISFACFGAPAPSWWNAERESAPHLSAALSTPVADMVATIRSTFSLRVTELASALQVERPTVYAWIRGETTPLERNYERLNGLSDVAKWWTSCKAPPLGETVRQSRSGEEPLTAVLASDDISFAKTRGRLRDLMAELRKAAEAPRADWERPGVFARRHGYDIGSQAEQEDRFSLETGKRLGPE